LVTGIVKWFNAGRGYGFIAPSNGGDDVFAHYASIETQGYKILEVGQKVEFNVQAGPKGPQAVDIRIIG
jgi:CspA family cold shock protein